MKKLKSLICAKYEKKFFCISLFYSLMYHTCNQFMIISKNLLLFSQTIFDSILLSLLEKLFKWTSNFDMAETYKIDENA
jgi:hypothetical protein